MGHSVGEYVAACVAGVFSLEEGLRLIATRGRLMQALPQDGDMVAVLADAARVTAAIAPYAAEVSLASLNGPEQVVVSGRRQAVQAIVATLAAAGIKTKPLMVSHAFHSPLMEPMLEDFARAAGAVTFASPRIELIANVSGRLATAAIATPAYWCRHVREPVRFAESMTTLRQQGADVLVEVGPQPILLGLGRQCVPHAGLLWLPSLRRGHADWQVLLQSVAALYRRGVPVDWRGFDHHYLRRKVVLPTYAFQRQRYWVARPAHGFHQAASFPQEPGLTSALNLLNQGDVAQLVRQLEDTGALTDDEVKVLPKLLTVLLDQQQLETAVSKDWFYRLEWQLKPRQLQGALAGAQNPALNRWLIFADQGGVGQTLAALLQGRGQSTILVYAGDRYETSGTGIWHINPANLADYQRLFQEMLETGAHAVEGIVHLWSVEAVQPDELSSASLEQAQVCGCGSVLHLVQALVKAEMASAPRLWLVTRGAVPAGRQSAPLSIAQAPLWGLGKVIALEHPEVWGGLLDLDPDAQCQDDDAAMLLAELWDAEGEDQLAWRDGQRYVARVVQSPQPVPQGLHIRTDGSYLITGGLGALGLHVARWLVNRGARHMVLIGRNGASSGAAQEAVNQLRQAGANILVAHADVSNEEDMISVFDEMTATMPPLRGLVHAAGVPGYQALKDIEHNTLVALLRPKVIGTWMLHQLTQGMPLDFFVGFSSIASMWGAKNQGHYAAANHFLDAVAHYRRSIGLFTMSVNWGPWAGGGMASAELQTWLTRIGVQALPPQQAVAALGCLLSADVAQVAVARVDWHLFKGVYEARTRRPLLEQIEMLPCEATQQPEVRRTETLQWLEEAPTHDRHALLMAHIQAEVAKVLGLEPSQLPEPQQGFFDMGMDSLMAVELKNRLEASLCSSFPATLAFDCPTIAHLTRYLAREVLGWDTPATAAELPTDADEQAKALSEVEQLSDEEVEVSITQRLAKLETLLRRD
jgi:acyl transferase domain-containing protein/acyl carrier protein